MAKTAAEKQKAYRDRQRHDLVCNARRTEPIGGELCSCLGRRKRNADGNGNAPNSNESVTVTDGNETVTKEELLERVIGPPPQPMDALKLYSQERWERLRVKGYIMPPEAEQYDGQLTLEGELPTGFHMGYARKVIAPGPVYQFAVPVPGDPGHVSEAC